MLKQILTAIFLINQITNNHAIVTETKLNFIESLNKELNIKHFTVIKDSNFEIDNKILILAKRLSFNKVFSSFLSVNQMISIMNEYYTIRDGLNLIEIFDRIGYQLIEKRTQLVYPPKTLVLIHGQNLDSTINQLFKVSPINRGKICTERN